MQDITEEIFEGKEKGRQYYLAKNLVTQYYQAPLPTNIQKYRFEESLNYLSHVYNESEYRILLADIYVEHGQYEKAKKLYESMTYHDSATYMLATLICKGKFGKPDYKLAYEYFKHTTLLLDDLYMKNFYKLNPYVREAQHIFGTSGDYFVPYRIIYDYEIMYIVKGELTVIVDNEAIISEKNDCIIIQPFLRHKQLIADGKSCEYYGIHLDFFYDETNTDFNSREIYSKPCEQRKFEVQVDPTLSKRKSYSFSKIGEFEKFTVTQSARFERIFNEIYQCHIQNDELSVLAMKANVLLLIQTILIDLVSSNGAANQNEIVSNFITYTTNHFKEDINITELAKQYGFSPNYFSKLFKTIINKTPKEFLINVRLDEAKKLLKLGLYTVSEVCTMVGYDDLHYFSRLFKQKEGVSPASFAKQATEEE